MPSQRARSTTLASPVPESASSASGGRRAGGAEPRTKGLDRSDMMNVIIAANFLRGPKKLAFDQPKVLASALGIVGLVLGLAFGAGFLARGAEGAARAEIANRDHRVAVLRAGRHDYFPAARCSRATAATTSIGCSSWMYWPEPGTVSATKSSSRSRSSSR